MKILLVSFFFPPYNTPGAVRTGKMAKQLVACGHEVRVLCADKPTLFGEVLPENLPLEIPEENVKRASWFNVNAIPRKLGHLLRGSSSKASGNSVGENGKATFKSLFYWPDERMGWYRNALKEGKRLVESWRPEVIYASGLPATVLLVGRALSKQSGVPWVAEFRDLWADSNYYPNHSWRQRIDRGWEKRVLKDAAGLVTVSEPLRGILKERYSKETAVVWNGFDPDDFPPADNLSPGSDGPLVITYTGSLYGGRRNPGPLFEAVQGLGSDAQKVQLRFFVSADCEGVVRQLAKEHAVEAQVQVFGLVSFEQSMKEQCESDVLLLLLGDSQRSEGVFTSKVFEYLGARRPVLVVGGNEKNVASRLILEREAGVHLHEVDEIKAQLSEWTKRKADGKLGRLDESVCSGLTRAEQVNGLIAFLSERLDTYNQR